MPTKIPKQIVSKYRNKISYCLSKHRHDSCAEADYCNSLLADQQAGKILGYDVQFPFEVAIGIKHIVDFIVYPARGALMEAHDVKGVQTAVWRMKHKLFLERYPQIKYVVVNRKEDNPWTNKKKRPALPKHLCRPS